MHTAGLWGRFCRGAVALFVGAGLAAGPAGARPVHHVRTETDIDWVSAGVSGAGGGSGTIQLSGVSGEVKLALLYWHGIDLTDDGGNGAYDNPVVSVNGVPVRGVPIGDATTNCWGSGSSRAYRADVTALVTGNGAYRITGLSEGEGHSANGASLVVVFDDGDDTNNKNLAFFEGNDSNFPRGFPGEDNGWHAVLEPVVWNGGPVRVQMHVADGQFFPDNWMTFDSGEGQTTIPDKYGLYDGFSVPSAGTSRAYNGQLWDIHDFDISSAMGSTKGRRQLRIDGQNPNSDCLGLVLMLVETEAKPRLFAVEFTQAIQYLSPIEELKVDLQEDREPPVPLIGERLIAVRVYFEDVESTATYKVKLEIPEANYVNTHSVTLVPGCDPFKQRERKNGCRGERFTLVAPAGEWNAAITLMDSSGRKIEKHEFPLFGRKADKLVLRSVAVCDSKRPTGGWNCASRRRLASLIGFLRGIAPAHSVTVSDTTHTVRHDLATYDSNGNGTIERDEMSRWWDDTVSEIGDLYGTWDRFLGVLGEQRYYFGMVRPNIPGGIGGMADGIPSRGAAGRISAVRLGTETNDEVVAHETGHMLGRKHTNTGSPAASGGRPPGCYSTAVDSSTDWPFSTNRLLEVGFDVYRGVPVDPSNNYETMGYCTPRWISTHTYRKMMEPLDAQPPSSAPKRRGMFWTVGGRITDAGVVFTPLFTRELTGTDGSGSGTHRIEVRDPSGAVLFTRRFDPRTPVAEDADGLEIETDPRFFELVPVQSGAEKLVVLNGTGAEIGALPLGGAAPQVAVVSPAAGDVWSGLREILWEIADEDSSDHWSRVEYSADGGASWSSLGTLHGATSLAVDFDALPGGESAVVRVLATDGVNTGEASSEPFSVDRKLPTVQITEPEDPAVFAAGEAIYLRAIAHDEDDGFLEGEAVVWSSDLAGDLGNGAELTLGSLEPGRHTVTVTATDNDGNEVSDEREIVVAGTLPEVSLDLVPTTPEPFSCVRVVIDASADAEAGLARVDYSIDGGNSYTAIPIAELPKSFTLPGTGLLHVVARAVDRAGQLAAQDDRIFIASECDTDNAPPVAKAGEDRELECEGGEGKTTADGSGSSDPDGDQLTCEWTSDTCSFEDAAACVTEVTCPLGANEITLVVSDGESMSDPDTAVVTVVDAEPPAGSITFPQSGACLHGPVTVTDDFTDVCETDLSRTYDPAGGPTYTAEGEWSVTLTVADSSGNSSAAVTRFLIDDTAPLVSLVPPLATQDLPRVDPIGVYLVTSDEDAAPGGVVTERILVDDCVALDGATYGNANGRLVDDTIEIVSGLLCQAYRACGRTTFTDPVVRAEAVDCAGNVGVAAVPVSGTFAVDPSSCR